MEISINSHAYVAETSQRASDEYFPTYAAMMNRIGRERGWSAMTRGQFEVGRSPRGALLVGSPEEVAEKILFEHELFGNTRFMAQISVGTLPHEKVMHAIELLGTEVAPAVRKELGRRSATGTGGPASV
jgi:alkanesulfonate monooxygenase SsuD/methylene tetrahydromethanopterin reductase-like flavin-dependent oxidoreductase (luciferase family)